MKHCLHLILLSLTNSYASQKKLVKKITFFAIITFFLLLNVQANAQTTIVTGHLTDSSAKALPGVTVATDKSKKIALTDNDGNFSIAVTPADKNLIFTYVGMKTETKPIAQESFFDVVMMPDISGLSDVIVVGYGTQKKGATTAAISTVTAKDIGRVHGGATASTTLAGKLPGVTFRQGEGRPGASASIQIRNMGTPLYVIDGIQQDEGQFNNLAPNDIESVTILKDASAAIYGVRGGNGVVVVTTKKGATGHNNINVDAYTGYQSFFRFPKVVNNTPDYLYYRADAEMNWFGSTSITQNVLDAAKQGTDPQYRSFDWRKYVLNNNGAPLNSVNINISGGSDKVSYYVSGTNLFQNSVLGSEYNFNRTNIQSNITVKLANGLKAGFDINGRVETRTNPGVPGGDDYFLARLAVLRNTPQERPYANDNPAYLNDLGPHLESNYAFLNNNLSGKLRSDWRVAQTNFHIEWDVPWIKGLSLRGLGSYYFADNLLNNQEYTYVAYTYIPPTDSSAEQYKPTGGSSNPWREREQIKRINTDIQVQATYNNTFGEHTVSATVVAERIKNHYLRNWLHASPQSNNLPLIYYNIMDRYEDADQTEAKIGYIARVTYSYANRYFIEGFGRRDASYLFALGQRVGYFPGISAAWRVTEEPLFKRLLNNKTNILSDLKFRASYGQLGDDRNLTNQNNSIVPEFAYLQGYTYGLIYNPDGSTTNLLPSIFNGNNITSSRDKGIPVTSLSWLVSRTTDIGADFSLFNGKLTGTFDWFKRKRTGIPAARNDVVLPVEIGYTLSKSNLESDEQYGEEGSLHYNGNMGNVRYSVGGNISYARSKYLNPYKPTFLNSWDKYRNSNINRFTDKDWGYICIGQFQSVDQINNYDVDIDGQGNKTLLPGDLIYKDVNGDKKINELDQRPISFGYGAQPMVNYGFTISLAYKGFDFHADFSGASGYTWFQNWEQRWAFQNNGNLNTIFTDRWHRANIYDLNSQWIPGKYPANRYNPGFSQSDYATQSTFWLHNVTYFRARTIELGYSLPQKWLSRAKIQNARIYANGYNLFSIDNLAQYGVDPEIVDDNGLQFPQNRVINFGINLSF